MTKEEREKVVAQMRVEIEAAIDAAKGNGKTVDAIVIRAARGAAKIQTTVRDVPAAMAKIDDFLADGWRFRRVLLASPKEAGHVAT